MGQVLLTWTVERSVCQAANRLLPKVPPAPMLLDDMGDLAGPNRVFALLQDLAGRADFDAMGRWIGLGHFLQSRSVGPVVTR